MEFVQSGFTSNGDYVDRRAPSTGSPLEVQKERPDEAGGLEEMKLRWKGIVGLDGETAME